MTAIGYAISCEEHGPADIVRHARLAEESGFGYALISDHYHPWLDKQGHSPFVWSVIGGIATATDRLRLGTGVTCPTVRVHPAVLAQASATAAAMMPGRFFFGLGTGEALNEHILGDRFPPAEIRREMLEEAIAVIRELWKGEWVTHHGNHYVVENARVYTLPDEPPPIAIAAAGPEAAALAGRLGDGFVGTAPQAETIEQFRDAGGGDKPRYGQVTVCWADSEEEGRKTAHEWWPNIALSGELGQVLPQPAHYEAAVEDVSEDDVAELVACGPDPERHVEMISRFEDAGYDHVYVHQVGPDQEGFMRFYEREIVPRYS